MLILLGACAPSGDGDHEVVTRSIEVSQPNGWKLNGWKLNGWKLNGWKLNGDELNGLRVKSFSINGAPVLGVALEGSLFHGWKKVGESWHEIEGEDFVGAKIVLEVLGDEEMNPHEFHLRLDAIAPDPTSESDDVYVYKLSYFDELTWTWKSPCGELGGVPVGAIPIGDAYWDEESGDRIDAPGAITMACRDGAIGKCAAWGYRPWIEAQLCADPPTCTTVDLAAAHQACTRMVRADFCGDGQSWTMNGVLIDVFDRFSPPILAREGYWPLEATWGPDGAVCIAGYRLDAMGALLPACAAGSLRAEITCPGTNKPVYDGFWTPEAVLASTYNDDP